MFKKLLVSGLVLVLLMGCGWLSLPQLGNPEPAMPSAAPVENPTVQPEPTATLRMPSRNTPTPDITQPQEIQPAPGVESQPEAAPVISQVEDPLYIVQPGTPTQVTNFLFPDAGCSYLGIAGQVFDINGQPVQGLIVEVSGQLEGNEVLQLVLTGSSTKLGPGGYEIRLAEHALASEGTLQIQVFDLAGLALSDAIAFNTSAECDANQILLNFTATKIEYDETIYFPFTSND